MRGLACPLDALTSQTTTNQALRPHTRSPTCPPNPTTPSPNCLDPAQSTEPLDPNCWIATQVLLESKKAIFHPANQKPETRNSRENVSVLPRSHPKPQALSPQPSTNCLLSQVMKTISSDGRLRRWQWELRKRRRCRLRIRVHVWGFWQTCVCCRVMIGVHSVTAMPLPWQAPRPPYLVRGIHW